MHQIELLKPDIFYVNVQNEDVVTVSVAGVIGYVGFQIVDILYAIKPVTFNFPGNE